MSCANQFKDDRDLNSNDAVTDSDGSFTIFSKLNSEGGIEFEIGLK